MKQLHDLEEFTIIDEHMYELEKELDGMTEELNQIQSTINALIHTIESEKPEDKHNE